MINYYLGNKSLMISMDLDIFHNNYTIQISFERNINHISEFF